MLQDNKMVLQNIYYILQPFHEQALVIANYIKKYSNSKIIAVLLSSDKCKDNHIYDEILFVGSYSELPRDLCNIIPTGAQSTEWMLQLGDIKLAHVEMKAESLMVFDKTAFLDYCQAIALPVPRQFSYEELNECCFPIFFKQRNEKGGGVRGIAHSLKELSNLSKEELIFQELIESPGTYGVAFLAKEGEIITSFTHYEVESYPVSGGSATVIQSMNDNARLFDLTSEFVKSFNYSGWGLAEYKFCNKRQDYVFMEINAKFWASCYFSFENNPIFLKELFDIEVPKKEIKTLIFINRLLNTGIIHTFKVLRKYFSAKKTIESSIFKSILKAILISLKLK